MELLLNAFVDFSVEGDRNGVVDSIQWCSNITLPRWHFNL